jgi:DNA polymerase
MMRMARPRRFDDKGGAIWWEDQTRIIRLVNYCMGDVAAERALDKKLNQLRQDERQIWLLDQMINDRGVRVDQKLCQVARKLVEGALIGLDAEIVEVSDGMISNVNGVAKIVAFCRAKGVPVDSIAAPIVEQLLTRDLPPDVHRVLEIRQLASKASVKKINALLNGMSPDGRARGMLAYHAASTGRWAGRRFQPQNLKRPVDHDQNGLIKLIRTGSPRAVQMLGGPVLDVVSDVLRGLIVAADGQQLFAADYSNIEGRALAWLAGEQWKLAAFRDYDNGTGPDLYKLAYARSFHVSVDSITGDQRQIGKVLELSLGYQGGVGAFQTMAVGYRVVVSDERANELKVAWREAHPAIVRFWPAVEIAAIRAVQNPGLITTAGRLSFRTAGEHLYMRLPSGRSLCYPYAKIMPQPTPWGSMKQTLTFKTVIGPNNAGRIIEADTGSWARIGVYGGLLAENATQAVARDVMAEAMLRVEVAGYPVILTVHDEIVAERSGGDLAEFKSLMETPPSWSKGFPIVAEAWTGNRYHKN